MEWLTRTWLDRSITLFWLDRINVKNSQTNFLEKKLITLNPLDHIKTKALKSNNTLKSNNNLLIQKSIQKISK